MPLNAQIMLSILAHETSAGDFSRTLRATPASYAATLTDGTGANQAQVVWSDSRTVTAADDYDFPNANGFSDDRGAVTFTAVKTVYIRNTGPVAISVSFPPAVPADTQVAPGAVFFASRTDASGWIQESMSVFNDSQINATYDVIIIGEGTVT